MFNLFSKLEHITLSQMLILLLFELNKKLKNMINLRFDKIFWKVWLELSIECDDWWLVLRASLTNILALEITEGSEILLGNYIN